MDLGGLRSRALDGEPIHRQLSEKAFGHLGPRGVVGAEEEDSLHSLKHGGGAERMPSAATVVTVCARSGDRKDVQEGPRVRSRVEDLRTRVEDQNEDDEDEHDDTDDHSGAKSTVVRHDRSTTRGVHVDLPLLNLLVPRWSVSLAASV